VGEKKETTNISGFVLPGRQSLTCLLASKASADTTLGHNTSLSPSLASCGQNRLKKELLGLTSNKAASYLRPSNRPSYGCFATAPVAAGRAPPPAAVPTRVAQRAGAPTPALSRPGLTARHKDSSFQNSGARCHT